MNIKNYDEIKAEARVIALKKKHRMMAGHTIDDIGLGGTHGIKVKLLDKIAKIHNLTGPNTARKVKDDSIRDIFLDIVNQAIYGVMLLDGTWCEKVLTSEVIEKTCSTCSWGSRKPREPDMEIDGCERCERNVAKFTLVTDNTLLTDNWKPKDVIMTERDFIEVLEKSIEGEPSQGDLDKKPEQKPKYRFRLHSEVPYQQWTERWTKKLYRYQGLHLPHSIWKAIPEYPNGLLLSSELDTKICMLNNFQKIRVDNCWIFRNMFVRIKSREGYFNQDDFDKEQKPKYRFKLKEEIHDDEWNERWAEKLSKYQGLPLPQSLWKSIPEHPKGLSISVETGDCWIFRNMFVRIKSKVKR